MELRQTVASFRLPEPTRSHAVALFRRAVHSGEVTSFEPVDVWATGLEYLACRVDDLAAECNVVAGRRNVRTTDVLHVLPVLRSASRYRAYVGEWIRADRSLNTKQENVVADAVATLVAIRADEVATDGFPRRGDVQLSSTAGTSLLEAERSSIWKRARKFLFQGRAQQPGMPGASSWTGTMGSKSYYNKDESPD